MPRPRFRITSDNYQAARDYLGHQIRNNTLGIKNAAALEWNQLPHSLDRKKAQSYAELVNDWCEEHLDSEQWSKLKNALRARRKRLSDQINGDDKVTVTLSRRAWMKLSSVAETNGVTLSQAIETFLRAP